MTTTQHLRIPGGEIAYELSGEGPLVVLAPGMADTRQSYRFLAPLLADAGYRVASVDLRGHGESSTGWNSYTRTETANDLLRLIEHLGGPATIVGQSFSGGAATIAAALEPAAVTAVVEIGPFTRPPGFSLGAFLRNDHNYRTGALLLGRYALSGSVTTWARYLDVAYPGRKPADWDTWLGALQRTLREPGRTEAARAMLASAPKDAAAHLALLQSPALVIMGTADSDFADPEAEAKSIVELLPAGLGQYRMLEGAGHYPHAQYPELVADAIIPFLAEHARDPR